MMVAILLVPTSIAEIIFLLAIFTSFVFLRFFLYQLSRSAILNLALRLRGLDFVSNEVGLVTFLDMSFKVGISLLDS